MREIDCPLGLPKIYGSTAAAEAAFSRNNTIDFYPLALEFLQNNEDAHWVLFRSDDQYPLESGTNRNRLKASMDCRTEENFEAKMKLFGIGGAVVLIYYEMPNIFDRLNHVRHDDVYAKEEMIVQNLKDEGLI